MYNFLWTLGWQPNPVIWMAGFPNMLFLHWLQRVICCMKKGLLKCCRKPVFLAGQDKCSLDGFIFRKCYLCCYPKYLSLPLYFVVVLALLSFVILNILIEVFWQCWQEACPWHMLKSKWHIPVVEWIPLFPTSFFCMLVLNVFALAELKRLVVGSCSNWYYWL